jgi:carboxylesterase type B
MATAGALALGVGLWVVCSAPAPAGSAQEKGGYEFVAPLEAVMEKVDDVYQSMEEKITKKDFKKLNKDALFIAEMANLAGHHKDFRDKKQWMDLSGSMKDDMLKLADAAKKMDGAAAKTLHKKVEETCDSCHEAFRDK